MEGKLRSTGEGRALASFQPCCIRLRKADIQMSALINSCSGKGLNLNPRDALLAQRRIAVIEPPRDVRGEGMLL